MAKSRLHQLAAQHLEMNRLTEKLVRELYPDSWDGKYPIPVDHFFEIAIPRLFWHQNDVYQSSTIWDHS